MNEHVTLDVGATPAVQVALVEGDLEIRGTSQAKIEATAKDGGHVGLEQDGEQVVLTANRGALLRLPRTARVTVVDVRGALQVRDLDSELEIDRVRGNAGLNRVAGARIDKIGGDLEARDIRGPLALQGAGGDVRLWHVAGSVQMALGGDLMAKNTKSPMNVTAGGNAVLQVELEGSEPVAVVAGGDIVCRLKGSPSAVVTLNNGGSRAVDLPGVKEDEAVPGRITIGEGEAEVTLRAGGDIWLGGIDSSAGAESVGAIGSRVAESVGKTLAEVEAGLAAMGAVMESVPEAEISTKVQRIVERAIRRRQRHQWRHGVSLPVAGGQATTSASVSDEERMKVLKMVESGKLSVEDAEKLFEALGV